MRVWGLNLSLNLIGFTMKQTIGFSQFCGAFRDADRKENFSYVGLRVLFDLLEKLEEQTGEDMELDVIAICCDYCEMSTDEIIKEYNIDITDDDCEPITDDEELEELVRDYLNDNTCIVGEVPGGFVFQVF